jgi:hypothetical protein
VAGPSMIEGYLTELRYSLAKLAEADEIVDEAADHLHTAAAAAIAGGVAPAVAEAQVVARFGSASLVARVFAEEAKRGSAVSTSSTRRAGVAAMVSVALLVVGQAGNHLTSRGVVHAGFLALVTAGFPALAVGLWGLRRRHGGLGAAGRVAFWWFVVSPVLAAPFLYAAPLVLAGEWLLIMSLLGISMLRAKVMPAPAVALFTMSPGLALVVILGMSAAHLDAGPWFLTLLAPVALGLAWLGWAMWHEPALDSIDKMANTGPLHVA